MNRSRKTQPELRMRLTNDRKTDNIGYWFQYDFLDIMALFARPAAHVGFAITHILNCVLVMLILTAHEYTVVEDGCGTYEHKISVRAMLFALSLISGIFHILQLVNNVAENLTKVDAFNAIRWVDYAITTPLIVTTIAILVKIDVLFTIVLIYCSMATYMLFGYIQDRRLADISVGILPYFFAWIPYIFSWVIVVKGYYNAVNLDSKGVSAYVHYIVIFMAVLLTLTSVNQLFFVVSLPSTDTITKRDLIAYEGGHHFIITCTKITFVYMALIGLRSEQT
jgi:hypothetical protein